MNPDQGQFVEFHINGLIAPNRQGSHLVIVNVNLPIQQLEDEASILSIRNWIETYFQDRLGHISFSFSASYLLRHRETGELRAWTGSFSPRHLGSFSWSRYNLYNATTFVQQVLQKTKPDVVLNFLRLANPLSVWEFNELRSVIITLNTRLPSTNVLVITRQGQQQLQFGRHFKSYKTFHVYLN